MSNIIEQTNNNGLFNELSLLIEQSKQRIAATANSTLTLLFWQVGKRINEEILNNERATYGKQIVATLAQQLENKYGRNFNEKNIRRMMRFSQEFSDFNILPPLAAQLSWSHFIELLHLKYIKTKERIETHKIEKI